MMIVTSEFMEQLEDELRRAPRAASPHLFHYTTTEAAILGILATRTLRLSPFRGTNDLWESRPLHVNLVGNFDSERWSDDEGQELWGEIDQYIRMYSKVACLTQDWDLPDHVHDSNALRGWAHLSLWAHYGAHHSGVCLRFDRQALLETFDASASTAIHQFSGPVRYRSVSIGAGPDGIDLEQAKEFGVDAVALDFASTQRDPLFFSKHSDWSNESEFRLVRTDLTLSPFALDISGSLNGVFLGDAFPRERIPALMAILEPFGEIEVFQLRFHNRRFYPWPISTQGPEVVGAESTRESKFARNRDGELSERLASLRTAEGEAKIARSLASARASQVIAALSEGTSLVVSSVLQWPEVLVSNYPHASAIPEGLRRQPPGVPGEVVDFEQGVMVVAEHQPQYSFTFVAAVAVQVLAEGQIRLHGAASIEEWLPAGNVTTELWRRQVECAFDEAALQVRTLVRELLNELPELRRVFDESRHIV